VILVSLSLTVQSFAPNTKVIDAPKKKASKIVYGSLAKTGEVANGKGIYPPLPGPEKIQ
jgi:hypothetical protein